eukprot:2481830-Rhodomonas_salina.1
MLYAQHDRRRADQAPWVGQVPEVHRADHELQAEESRVSRRLRCDAHRCMRGSVTMQGALDVVHTAAIRVATTRTLWGSNVCYCLPILYSTQLYAPTAFLQLELITTVPFEMFPAR